MRAEEEQAIQMKVEEEKARIRAEEEAAAMELQLRLQRQEEERIAAEIKRAGKLFLYINGYYVIITLLLPPLTI